jgi:hypothetical protein
LEGYQDLLRTLVELDLVESVAPVQLAIRLLIPSGSLALELESVRKVIHAFDEESLCYPWKHPDPRVDELQLCVEQIVENSAATNILRPRVFEEIWRVTEQGIGHLRSADLNLATQSANPLPHLSEPWYCCAEPTKKQLQAFI